MKPVGEISTKVASSDYKTSHEEPRKPYTDDEKNEMDFLFSLLLVEYPRFYNIENTKDTSRKRTMWIKLLRPYSKEARAKALETCLKTIHNKGGPTVGQFMGFCKTPAAHKRLERPALEAPKNESVGRKALAELKEKLRGKS